MMSRLYIDLTGHQRVTGLCAYGKLNESFCFTGGYEDNNSGIIMQQSKLPLAWRIFMQVPPPGQCWDSYAMLIIRRMYYKTEFSLLKLVL